MGGDREAVGDRRRPFELDAVALPDALSVAISSAMRAVLLEKGLFTEQELSAKMAEIRARFNVPDEMESPIKKGAKK